MNIWLIKDGENLPLQPQSRRMRTWMLAEELQHRGHLVTWWASTFYHQHKRLLYNRDVKFEITPNFNLLLLYSGQYNSNFSFRRYLHHRRLANRFVYCTKNNSVPDIIVCSFPLIDLAYVAMIYAKANNIPIIIDVRDLWPETILEIFPNLLKPIGRIVLRRDFKRTVKLLTNANSLVAVSKGFLGWALEYAARPPCKNDKVFYLGYPVKKINLNNQSEIVKKIKSVADKKIIFTFVGSFGYSYELNLICDLAQTLYDQGNNKIHFAIAGDGEQSRVISSRVKNLPNFSLLGWINEEEIKELLSVSDVGLVPCKSVRDIMPNKPFEYFSAGLPIISSLEGEMEGLIKEHNVGFSYKPGDVQTLYKHVLHIAQDNELRESFGLNALNLLKKKFSADMIYGDYANHIEELANVQEMKQ